jgi:DUF1365 family protein
MFMMYLDLAELPQVFDLHPFWTVEGRGLANFRRRDHHGDTCESLEESTRRLVEARSGVRPRGPIRLLTHLSYFGYCFNPVSLYYCFDEQGDGLEAIVAEVNNTPWGEQHCYVLAHGANDPTRNHHRWRFPKAFHVSPFMDMNQCYDWRLTSPADRLVVHTINIEHGREVFDATMVLERREITRAALSSVLWRYPGMTARVIGAIYWQAFRLWWKGTPSFVHPDKRVHHIGETG